MSERMNIAAVTPEGYRAVLALEKYVRGRIDHDLLELVKLRASIINGCTFCVDMHATDALEAGEDVRRVIAVAAWRESPFFTDRERAALELTETVTRLGDHAVPDEVWDTAMKEFGEVGVADLLLAIATINVWNRVSIASRTAPPALSSDAQPDS
jgi:AhpD family alkylhydroperoxidase